MTKLQVAWLLGTALALTGCQQQSEIDKCVEALVVSECMNSDDKKNCVNGLKDALGGLFRLECLKAQAGNK